MAKVGVCVPTRGVVFTEVMQGITDNISGRDARLFTTGDLSITDALTDTVERALAWGASHIWVVEEDTVPPAGILTAMLAKRAPYVAVDYPVGDSHTCFGFDGDGLLWTGFGCTLIRAGVFNQIQRPWFTSTRDMCVERRSGLSFFVVDEKATTNPRGGHDLEFGIKLKAAGVPVTALEGVECRHLRVKSWNAARTNHACHVVESLPPIAAPWTEYLAADTVSIVIPCYGQAEFLSDAIESALAQTHPCEVIVVDDGSPDDTAGVARRYPVRLIRQKNQGLSAARNAGIAQATGRSILPLDADDMLVPNAVERMLRASTGGIVRSHMQEFGDSDRLVKLPSGTAITDFISGNRACCASMFPRRAWERVGGYDESMLDGYEDWDFWVRLVAHKYQVATVPDALLLYRKHGTTMISTSRERHADIYAYMAQKWERLGIMRPRPTPRIKELTYPVALGVAVTHNGRRYPRGSRVDHSTALAMKNAGLLKDPRIC